jgi:hypothetical protein
LDSFRKSTRPSELDAIAAEARALRDWFKPFIYKHMGRPVEPDALRELEPLNELLARDAEYGQIVIRDGGAGPQHDDVDQKTGMSGLAPAALAVT